MKMAFRFMVSGAVLAAALVCAFAADSGAREWIEFKAAPGIGLPEGCWLRSTDGGYADLGRARVRRRPVVHASVEPHPASESIYVDLGAK